jgi:hypothetical protein
MSHHGCFLLIERVVYTGLAATVSMAISHRNAAAGSVLESGFVSVAVPVCDRGICETDQA